MDKVTSISQAHAMCFNSFSKLISVIEHPVRDFSDQVPLNDAVEAFDKYKLWAANVGAAHFGSWYKISLDYRLREASFYKTQVLELLGVLDNIVDKVTLLLQDKKPFEELPPVGCKSTSDAAAPPEDDSDEETEAEDSPWEISSSSGDEAGPRDRPEHVDKHSSPIPVPEPIGEVARLLQSIKFTIVCLYKLPIRRPAPLDRLKQKQPISESHYQHFDILYVKDKFPALDPEVATRLGKLISRRRQLLFYRLSHREALQITNRAPDIIMPAPPIAEQVARKAASIATEINQIQAAGSGHTLHTEAMTLRTKATTLRINTPQVETLQALCPPSVASSVSSMASSYTGGSLRVEVPPRPKGDNGEELKTFECPYCFILQTIETGHKWKKHVLGDLQPYVCTYPDCGLLEHFFDSREEWHKHETQQHRAKWFCDTMGHPKYAERTDFLAHMSRDHSTTFNDSQLALLPSMFQCAPGGENGVCNLCKRSCVRLKCHVSRHLEQIALFALPRVNETEGLNSHSSGQNVSSLAACPQGGPKTPQSSSSELESKLSGYTDDDGGMEDGGLLDHDNHRDRPRVRPPRLNLIIPDYEGPIPALGLAGEYDRDAIREAYIKGLPMPGREEPLPPPPREGREGGPKHEDADPKPERMIHAPPPTSELAPIKRKQLPPLREGQEGRSKQEDADLKPQPMIHAPPSAFPPPPPPPPPTRIPAPIIPTLPSTPSVAPSAPLAVPPPPRDGRASPAFDSRSQNMPVSPKPQPSIKSTPEKSKKPKVLRFLSSLIGKKSEPHGGGRASQPEPPRQHSDQPISQVSPNETEEDGEHAVEHTFGDDKVPTLDDIPRIIAAEQARDQRPNAFKRQTHAPNYPSSSPGQPRSANRMFSSSDRGPLADQPAFIPDGSSTTSSINEAPLAPEKSLEIFPTNPSDPASPSEAAPVLDRWAQIRKNAAERMKTLNASNEFTRSDARGSIGGGEAGGEESIDEEESIEARVAKIRARIAKLNANMDLTNP